MIILGCSGSNKLLHEPWYNYDSYHDSAAVLIVNGKIVAGIEEERLNRIKHTNKAPINAIKYCLDSFGIALEDVDKIAFYGDEKIYNATFKEYCKMNGQTYIDIRTKFKQCLDEAFKVNLDKEKIIFVPHHISHFMSSFPISGFNESLVMILDGAGDNLSGMIVDARNGGYEILRKIPLSKSLGQFYLEVIKIMGYGMFDEYKVMGLAPYGDAGNYRGIFSKFYELLPNGDYKINMNLIPAIYQLAPLRKKGEPFIQVYKDIAASLQESLENIVFHVLKHFLEFTKHRKLCLAGGVAQNCSLVGKISYSQLVDDIFISPAAHDAGCALGAALYVHHNLQGNIEVQQIKEVFWGSSISTGNQLEQEICEWNEFVSYEKIPNITERTAALLADGAVIGWVQGKSEFGPRALGNRSIIADPRPAKNKLLINQMVKKRESYRPFAPSVLEEHVESFFDIPKTLKNSKQFPFMNTVLKVKEEKQSILGATTHIDGTARIQTVSKETNKIYWELIQEFNRITGIPVLLNTSFNNNVEPIVNTVNDALVSFLTTNIDYLVIGEFLITKKRVDTNTFFTLIPCIANHIYLNQEKIFNGVSQEIVSKIKTNYKESIYSNISEPVFRILFHANGEKKLEELIQDVGLKEINNNELMREIEELWSNRFIRLTPSTTNKTLEK